MRAPTIRLLCMTLALALPAGVSADKTLQLLPTLGGTQGIAEDINNRGAVVGESTVTSDSSPEHPNADPAHACLWVSGRAQDLGLLYGTGASQANAINNHDQIVGRSSSASGYDHAFRWEAGVMIDLGTVEQALNASTEALDINDAGQIVGYSGPFAVLWMDGTPQILQAPEDTISRAVAINERGQIAGNVTRSETMAVLWEGDAMTELGTLGGAWSTASGINARGQVVGHSETADRSVHGFLWQDGVMTDLGPDLNPLDINNAGIIVGEISTSSDPMLRAGTWTRRDGAVTIGPSDRLSKATAINARKDVAGYVVVDGGTRAAIWR